MKRIFLTILIFCFIGIANPALANKKTYIGLGYQTGKGTHKLKTDFGTEKIDIDTSTYNLILGSEINDYLRLQGGMHLLNYESKHSADGLEIKALGFHFDSQFYTRLNRLKPYLSIGIETNIWDYDEDFFGDNLSEDYILGAGLRFGAGVIFELAQSFEFEVAALYKTAIWQKIDYHTDTLKQETDAIDLNLGLNFKF